MTIFNSIRAANSQATSRATLDRSANRVGLPAEFLERLDTADHPDDLDWDQRYRQAFPWAVITRPASTLAQPEVAASTKKLGRAVDAHTYEDLTLALSVGIPAARIVMHDDGITAAPIRCGVNAGVGQLILRCRQQVALLGACAQRPQRVLVDITAGCAFDAIAAVLARPRLNLIGLHAGLVPNATRKTHVENIVEMIAQMSQIRRDQDVILTRVSLACHGLPRGDVATMSDLHALAAELNDGFDDACARFRFPRPALVLALTGTGHSEFGSLEPNASLRHC